MTASISLQEAAQVMREAMRETVRRYRIWYLAQAGLMVLAGGVALLYPLFSSDAVVLWLGWLLVVAGLVQGMGLIGATNVPHFWLQLVSAVLSVVIGLLFVRDPGIAVVSLTLLLTVFFVVEGIAKVVFALTIRPMRNWAWVLGGGILSIALAGFLVDNTGPALWLLGLLIGIQLITAGGALGYLAWTSREESVPVVVQEPV